jgi:phosphoribosyl 1,2-cyclic phosphodiesterase
MLRFASLGSGSRGNALLVESDATLLLIDCGLSRRAVTERMGQLGRDPSDITALLVTHEHGDHSRGIGPLVARFGMPVFATPGTASAIERLGHFEALNCHRGLTIGSVDVEPFPVPHDAREPCQFAFEVRGRRLGLLTDTGHITAHIRERLAHCDALALEFNHDTESLEHGPYPEAVKARVASNFGHLNNAQALGLLRDVAHRGLQSVLGLHLSQQNNSGELVAACVAEHVAREDLAFAVAEQDQPSDWIAVA